MTITVMVCVNERSSAQPSCAQRGGVQLADSLENVLAEYDLGVPVKRILCFGRCKEGPVMRIAPGGVFFVGMTRERLGEVVAAVQTAILISGG